MADESRLQMHPEVKTNSMKRGPLYAVVVVAACLFLYLANSMGLLEDTTKPKPAPEPEEAAPARPVPLIPEAEAPAGVLGKTEEKPSEPEESPEDEPISITVQVPDNGTEQMRRQVEAFRQQRAAAALAALSAPMRVQTVSSAGSVPEASPVSGSGQKSDGMDGLADADPARRAAMDREEFMSRSGRDDWTSDYTRVPGHACELQTGTVIPGVMLTGINSDLPGALIGQVAQDVFDSATGRFLLIPKGSRLYGVYDSRVAMGQRRILVAWQRIIFPDGSSVTLEAMPGASRDGYAGFQDQIDNHSLRIFGNAILMSMISGGMAYSLDTLDNSNSSEDKPSLQNEMGSALASQLGQASLQLLQRNMNISPTLEIRPGYRFNIVLTKDLRFEAPYAG